MTEEIFGIEESLLAVITKETDLSVLDGLTRSMHAVTTGVLGREGLKLFLRKGLKLV